MAKRRRAAAREIEFTLEWVRHLKRRVKQVLRLLELQEKSMVKFRDRHKASPEEIKAANKLYQGGAEIGKVLAESRRALQRTLDET